MSDERSARQHGRTIVCRPAPAPATRVVGGTSGIGLAIALGLAEAGCDVLATSRRQEQVDAAASAIETSA